MDESTGKELIEGENKMRAEGEMKKGRGEGRDGKEDKLRGKVGGGEGGEKEK